MADISDKINNSKEKGKSAPYYLLQESSRRRRIYVFVLDFSDEEDDHLNLAQISSSSTRRTSLSSEKHLKSDPDLDKHLQPTDDTIPSVEKSYESEEEKIFTRKLYKFMAERGQPILKVPSLGFQDLNLHKLYHSVIKRGGMDNVTKNQAWKAVYLDLGLSTMSTSASYNTRTNYKK